MDWHAELLRLCGSDSKLVIHCQGASVRCEWLAMGCGLGSREQKIASLAGLLHDVGKSPALAQEGRLHQLTGADYLMGLGQERLASLVAHHSGGYLEALRAGVDLHPYHKEESLLADILDLGDLLTGPEGQLLSVRERYVDIVHRYGTSDLAITDYLPEVRQIRERVLDAAAPGPVHDFVAEYCRI